jgi:protein phosphatase 1 regulatory subunit 37
MECCRTREEMGIQGIKLLLKEYPTIPPRTIDLSNEVISHGAIDALSDLLSVNFGLKKLVLENCGIDDEVSLRIRAHLKLTSLTSSFLQSVKPLLHALLVSGNVPTLSLANNKRIKSKGWKLIAIFLRKVRLDCSITHCATKLY